MESLLHAALEFLAAHPHAIWVFVFLASFVESLAIVGTFIPGSTLIIAAGALVPLAGVRLWPVILWAIAGAIGGDGLSYWLGHRYKQRIRALRFFRRHPQILEKTEQFCRRHGEKSVFLGRFTQAFRAVVPLVAGMVSMPVPRFLVANVLSAVLWAPLHLLPGLALGASLSLAAAVTSRLLALVVLLFATILATVWLTRLVVRAAVARLPTLRTRALSWSMASDSFVRRKARALLDPDENEARVLLLLGALLVGGGWAFTVLVGRVLARGEIVAVDSTVYHLLQGLRTPWGDRFMVGVTQLGDGIVITAVAVAVLLWLLGHRLYRRAAYWASALAASTVFLYGLKALFGLPRPPAIADMMQTNTFPSGHSAMSAVLFGSLAMLVMPEVRLRWKILVATTAAVIVMAIAASRLYLGAHWLSDVLGGLAFGVMWVSALSIAFVRHRKERVRAGGLLLLAGTTFVVVGGAHIAHDYPSNVTQYAREEPLRAMSAEAWWEGGFRALPARRIDLEGENREPLSIQWAGDLDALRQRLAQGGFVDPKPWSVKGLLSWLAPGVDPMSLPVLPRLHDGQQTALVMIHPAERAGEPARVVLRIWPSNTVIIDRRGGEHPIWVGTATRERLSQPLSLLTLARSEHDIDGPRALVEEWLPDDRLAGRVKVIPSPTWDGKVLLGRATSIPVLRPEPAQP